ncbi:MAG: hypothetical protein KAT93_05955 [Desulfuromonadales bacterium]|nr:hypothetical protein [Desulfuromonadales bacterium]
MAIPQINLDYFGEPARLHCPVCGQGVYAEGGSTVLCQHVVFAGETIGGQQEWRNAVLEAKFMQAMQQKYVATGRHVFYDSLNAWLDSLGVDIIARNAAELLTGKSVFMLSITTADKGCGGMCNGTIYAIFDYLAGG